MRILTADQLHQSAVACILVLVLCASPLTAFAAPTTPSIQQKQAEAAAASAELQSMNDELEVQIEEYNAINEALDETREQILDARSELESAEQELATAQDTLAQRAASIYRSGGTDILDVFLGARSFGDFLVRVDFAVRINRSDAKNVAAVEAAKSRVEATERGLEQRESEQLTLLAEAEKRRASIEAEIKRQEDYANALDAEVKKLVAAEEERQRKLAEERARRAAERARQATASAKPRTATDAGSLRPGHPEVVAIALQYLGVRYVYGGSSPSGFDCSGLTSYVYRQIGINLPRTSRAQYGVGQHIAPDRLDLLKPGDLVFFGTGGDPGRVHHVGIYVGDGNYVHAPQTGDVVKVSSLVDRISSRGDYVGASRL